MTTMAIKTGANTPVRNLGLLLLAQVVLAVVLLAWQGRGATADPKPLLSFDEKSVDRLIIEGPENANVELQRKGSGDAAQWVVTGAGDFPADSARIQQVLSRLKGLEVIAPLATSSAAAERFKVSDDSFERRIQAVAGGKAVATLLLGNSQGLRQTSARKGGDDGVYAVDWATYEVATRNEDWIEKGLLRIPTDQVTGVEANGRTLDEEATRRVSQNLTSLYFSGLKGTGEEARKGLGKPELELVIQRREGGPVTYTIHTLPDTEDRALVVSNRQEVFTIGSSQAAALKGAVEEEKSEP